MTRGQTLLWSHISYINGISVFCGWVKKGTGLKCTLNVKMTKTFSEKVCWYWYVCFLWEHSLKHRHHYEPTHDRWQLASSHIGLSKFLEVFLFHLGSGGTRPRRRTSRPTTPHPPLSSFTSFRCSQYSVWSWWLSESWHWHAWPSTHTYDSLTDGLCALSYTRSSG